LKVKDLKNNAFTPAPIYIVAAKLEKTHKTTLAGFQNVQPKCKPPHQCIGVRGKLVRGFTLIEALIALVILGIAAAGLILPFASSAAVQEQGCSRTIAAKLACDLTEQIIAADFNQIVPTYGSYNEPKGQVKNAAGVVFTDSMYADFSRQAVCEYIYMPQQQSFGAYNFIRITVKVYQNDLKLAEVVRLKSK
jgi:prepilin-type N-terminal cleavage/methylation domain-containing protein